MYHGIVVRMARDAGVWKNILDKMVIIVYIKLHILYNNL